MSITYSNAVPSVSETTPVTSPMALSVQALNFDADWRVVEESPGKIVYTNVNADVDVPCTIRIQQTLRPNVYAGTGIEPGGQCATKRGCDTVIEFKNIWKLTDDSDPSSAVYLPVRAALTLNTPVHPMTTISNVQEILYALFGAIADKAEASDLSAGLALLLHGVVEKQ